MQSCLNGRDLRSFPLLRRKEILKELIKRTSPAGIQFSDHVEEKGDDDVANLVNLRFMSEYHGKPAEVVMDRRGRGERFVVMNDEFRKEKRAHGDRDDDRGKGEVKYDKGKNKKEKNKGRGNGHGRND
jgi:hypothetical protein